MYVSQFNLSRCRIILCVIAALFNRLEYDRVEDSRLLVLNSRLGWERTSWLGRDCDTGGDKDRAPLHDSTNLRGTGCSSELYRAKDAITSSHFSRAALLSVAI